MGHKSNGLNAAKRLQKRRHEGRWHFDKWIRKNLDLKKICKMLDTVVDRLEGELREYRLKPFVDDDFSGVRDYQSELIDLFKKHGSIRKNDVLDLLGIDASDSVAIKGVGKQIRGLEEYGIIMDVGAKWKWVI